MKTLATFVSVLFLLCANIASGQNQFGSPTINANLAILLGSKDTIVRCTLVPQDLMKKHEELHYDDTCHAPVPTCLAEHVMILDVPKYEDVRVVVPIIDTLERIFRDDYMNSLVLLLQTNQFGKQGFSPGRFVDLQGDTLMRTVSMPDFLVREIIYRWVAHRDLCTLVVGWEVYRGDLIDDIHEVLPEAWKLYVEGDYPGDWYDVPRSVDRSFYRGYDYTTLSITDGRGVHLKIP
jgi:hypothetical protein